MKYKNIKMNDDYYNKLFEIGCDLYDMQGSGEYDIEILNDVALELFELTSKQFDPDNYIVAKYKQLKEDITQDIYIKKHLLEKEFHKLKDDLQEEYERKYEEFKNDLLKEYKQ